METNNQFNLDLNGVLATASLLNDQAPAACKAFMKVIPFTSDAIHARWCGNEIWTTMPEMDIQADENLTIFPTPGDILLVKVKPKVYHLAIFYGRGWCFGPEGFIPSIHVATIEDNLFEFSVQSEKLLMEGKSKIKIY